MLEARAKFEAIKAKCDSWRGWCATNIPGRKYRDIKKVSALARDPDPIAAVARERERNAADQRAARERKAREAAEAAKGGSDVRPPTDTNVVPLNAPPAQSDNPESNDGEDMPSQPVVSAPNPSAQVRGPRIQRGKNNSIKTKKDFALDIVKHFSNQFNEGDNFLDPCYGDGAFFTLSTILPNLIIGIGVKSILIPMSSEIMDGVTSSNTPTILLG